MRFENEKDIKRESEAIDKLISYKSEHNLSYKKLGDNDVDFLLFKDSKQIAVVEVKGRNKNIDDAFHLPIALRKVAKIQDHFHTGIIIWSCYDGIIYGFIRMLQGEIKYGGRSPRLGSTNDQEIMIYYKKQDNLTTIKNKEDGR